MGSAGGNSPTGRVIGLVFGFAVLALLASVMFGSVNDPSVSIRSGEVVTPTEGRTVVYLEKGQSNIHCTATTSDGKTQSLAPFTGSHPERRFGPRKRIWRSGGKDYRAVGVLPLDRGPVSVRCPGADRMWVGAPKGWSWEFVVLVPALLVCVVIMAVVLWRRRGKRNGGGQGPTHPTPPQQGYPGYPAPGYPPQGYPGYPAPGYPNQGYPPHPDYPR